MRTEIHLTIRDYFSRSTGPGHQPGTIQRGSIPSWGDHPSFSEALNEAQAVHSGKQQGMSIQDYLHRRIRSHSGPVICGPGTATPLRMLPPRSGPQAPTSQEVSAERVMPSAAAIPPLKPQEDSTAGDRDKILASIDKAAVRYNLPAALIKAMVKVESDYQIRAVSPAGARGLMQLMPATAKELGVADPFDIDQNINGGAQYLRAMLDRFNGDVHLALTAYNAGPGTVARYAGNVPYAETLSYVQRVLRYTEEFSAPVVT